MSVHWKIFGKGVQGITPSERQRFSVSVHDRKRGVNRSTRRKFSAREQHPAAK